MTSKTKNQKSQKNLIYVLIATITILVVILAFVITRYAYNHDDHNGHNTVSVELGSYEYDYSNGKAKKLNDTNISELRSFLTETGKKDVSDNCKDVFYQVGAYTKNKDQILLNYGCNNPGAKMFAVKESGKWKFLSPTNQFDLLGIPLCSHVDQNNIDKSIAPVCYNETGDTNNPVSYRVR